MTETTSGLFDAAGLEKFFIGFLGERLAAMGELESGLYNYYRRYFWDCGRGFASHDLPVADFLREAPGGIRKAVEVGAGIGQLSALLAARGLEAFALERDSRRAAAAREFFSRLAAADPRFAGRLHLHIDQFPCETLPVPDTSTAAVFANIVNSDADLVEPRLLSGIGGYGGLFVDLVKFSRPRLQPQEWESLTRRIMTAGYGEPRPIFSSGEPGSDGLAGTARVVFFPAHG